MECSFLQMKQPEILQVATMGPEVDSIETREDAKMRIGKWCHFLESPRKNGWNIYRMRKFLLGIEVFL